METQKEQKSQNVLIFEKRNDFYWKSIAIYSIVLIIYSLLRGTFEEGYLTLKIYDPIVILLALIILISAIRYLLTFWKSPKILISKDTIVFKTRYYEKKFNPQNILKIVFSKERIQNLKGSLRVIKIYVVGRKKPYRIRPNTFWNSNELFGALLTFKKSHKK